MDSIRIADLTPEKIQAWKVEFLKKASANPLLHKRAISTVSSVIRAGKALFAKGVTGHLMLRLPSRLPFEGVKAGNTGNHRYKSEVNAGLLLQQATRELQPSQPDVFKIVLLALGAGLRRDEIDTLTWKQIDWSKNTIRVETNVHTSTKSFDSESEVDVDPALLSYLREFFKTSQSEFVIDSAVATRPGTVSYHHYRCNRLFKQAVVWLRAKGVGARNPLHSLRKEFGSLICAQAGIFAASSALRHSNITLTRDYYVDKKHPIRLAIGELLKASQTTGTEDSAATPQSAEPAA